MTSAGGVDDEDGGLLPPFPPSPPPVVVDGAALVSEDPVSLGSVATSVVVSGASDDAVWHLASAKPAQKRVRTEIRIVNVQSGDERSVSDDRRMI